jgi:hypothetical protein
VFFAINATCIMFQELDLGLTAGAK